MISRDAVELALTSPIDWEKFETIVAEILREDDFPRIRKLGGRGDHGADAVDEVFFADDSRIEAIIQVTSQKTQVEKFRETISRLKETHTNFAHLVIVYRQPVASTTRTEIQQEGKRLGISVDIRDQSYLVAQLGRPDSTIFLRHFSGIREQVERLLARPDPLSIATNKVRHAMLASMGAYVLNSKARLARQTLFEKTVLAALVATGETTLNGLRDEVRQLLPKEAVPEDQIAAALESLKKSGECEITNQGLIRASEATVTSLGHVIATTSNAYNKLRDSILANISRASKLDDATKGYVERNLRRAFLSLFRAYGPISLDATPASIPSQVESDLLRIMSKDLPEAVGRTALAALGGYVEKPDNWHDLKTFAQSYSALAIRNIDPIGRQWQQARTYLKIGCRVRLRVS